ncbi:MAG TPA: M20 family metallo-hydrolase [Gemmatimonadaceae bacterium]|nr:M20 family metallo-hydrolase [Gemmatimonadaceae bacterium]
MNRREFGAAVAGVLGSRILEGSLIRGAAAPRVNGRRLNERLAALARFGADPTGGVTRLAYGDADLAAREHVIGLMRQAGLETSIDVAGNIIGKRAGREPRLTPLAFGSHIDSVPEGGRYDGPVGSIAAIEVAQTLVDAGVETRHPLEVLIFQNEEGGLFGSRALAGELAERELDLVSRSGKSIRDGIAFIGGDPSRLASARRARGSIAAFLELHIEQGSVLYDEKVDIGIVEGIVGIHWWDVTIEGFANHAGTTPMNRRRDSLLAAAKFIEAVNRVATGVPGRQVATVGRIQALPGAPNVIAGTVTLSLEVRDLDAGKMRMLADRIRAEATAIAEATGTRFSYAETFASEPAPTDARIRAALAGAAAELGLGTKAMPSGAGHDAQVMSRLGPVGMIFVPSVDGVSHSPRELSAPEDIENGANVLLGALLALDAD